MCGDDQESPSWDRDIGTTPEEYPFTLILSPVDLGNLLPENFFPDDTFMEEIIQVNCFHYTEKEVPQPQVREALGLTN